MPRPRPSKMLPVELPAFEAAWWPLQMETIPGSGERLTVAIVARAASGQAQIRQSIAPALLATLFGTPAGKGMQTFVGTTVLSVQHQLDAGVAVSDLELPFGGFAFGGERDCVSRDLSEVFDIAVRLSAAFGLSPFAVQEPGGGSSRLAFDDWFDRVRTALLSQELRHQFDPAEFNIRVRLAKKKVQFGFVRGAYAANFAVLRPGHTSGDSRSLKVKVFDLEALRRDQILPIDHAEVLLGCPPHEALGAFSSREVDTFHDSLAFIEAEATARNVTVVRFANHHDAARHVKARLQA